MSSPKLDEIERRIDDLRNILNERGLIRQYSLSVWESLQIIKDQLDSIVHSNENIENSELLQRARKLLDSTAKLQLVQKSCVPLNVLERKLSTSFENAETSDCPAIDNSSNLNSNILTNHGYNICNGAPSAYNNTGDTYDQIDPEVMITRMLSENGSISRTQSINNTILPMEIESNEKDIHKMTNLYSWGRSDLGALLHADTQVHLPSEAVLFSSQRTIVQVASSDYHTAAVSTTGELYVCGSNEEGQVADDPSLKLVVRPRLMDTLQNHRIYMVACGSYHTVCVTATGVVLSFGGNEVGQLGHSSGIMSNVPPRMMEGLVGKVATTVCCGELYSLLLTTSGEVYSCGVGTTSGHRHANNSYRAERLEALAGRSIRMIAGGAHHSLAATATSELYGWGSDLYGQLGLANVAVDGHVQTPTRIPIQESFGILVGMSAGYNHTVLWTASGILCGSGSNKYGQLGNSVLPRLDTFTAIDLMNTIRPNIRCVGAACGSNHTVVLCECDGVGSGDPISNRSLVAFGSNSFGQCGTDISFSVQRTPADIAVLSGRGLVTIAAGGDQSFAIGVPVDTVFSESNGGVLSRQYSVRFSSAPTPLTTEEFLRITSICNTDTKAISVVYEKIIPLFASTSLLGGSFIAPSCLLTLDVLGLEACYSSLLLLGEAVVVRLINALQMSVDELVAASNSEEISDGAVRAMLVIWQCPLNSNVALTETLIRSLASLMNKLSLSLREALTQVIRTYPSHLFASRILQPLQVHLSHTVKRNWKASTSSSSNISESPITQLCNAIGWLYVMNITAKLVPYEEFYNQGINELGESELIQDYIQWRQLLLGNNGSNSNNKTNIPENKNMNTNSFHYCNYAFLLSVQTKRQLLLAESSIQQQMAQQEAFRMGFMMGGVIMPFFVVQVARPHLVQHTLHIISMARDYELKKPMKVIFAGEEGIDEGGVKKEFFQLLVSQLFDLQFGMFIPVYDNRYVWFNKDCTWSQDEFALLGVLIGLAVYNDVILDIHFPRVLYKKLLRHTVGLEDLLNIDPELYKGLNSLLHFEPASDIEHVFCRSFEVCWDDLGVSRKHELLPNGSNIPVDASNRDQYVDLYVQWVLVQSISTQFNSFFQGFSRVIHPSTTTLFRAEELELLVTGTPHLDFLKLEHSTEYIGDANWKANNTTIKSFWNVLKSLPFPDRQKFLMFTTGSTKAPMGGLSQLRFKIQRMGPDSDLLPTAHTCFNTLLLPEYSTEQKLKDRLLKAIYECEGFGLK